MGGPGGTRTCLRARLGALPFVVTATACGAAEAPVHYVDIEAPSAESAPQSARATSPAEPPTCPAGSGWDEWRHVCAIPDHGGRAQWRPPSDSRPKLDPCGDPDALVDCHHHDAPLSSPRP